MTNPAISIIISMYNVERYLCECLDSILNQTFDDYEVIIIDNGSTDNSHAVLEGYIPKFGEKLRIINFEKNTGSPSIPWNTGIDLSLGEYICFVDSDDAIINNCALEELYSSAKKFNADLIQCEKHYDNYGAPRKAAITDKNYLREVSEGWTEFVTEPTLASKNLEDRIEDFGFYRLYPVPWNRLFRREFIVQHKIKFPDLRCGQDLFFNFFVLCLAKNVVRVPTIYYVWRRNPSSVTHAELPVEKLVDRWIDSTVRGMPILYKFMDKLEFFQKKPKYKYLALETIVHYHLSQIFTVYEKIPDIKLGGFIPSSQMDTLIDKYMRDIEDEEDKIILLKIFFNRMNFFQVQRAKFKKESDAQKEQILKLQKENAEK